MNRLPFATARFVARAEDAETRGDYDRAAQWWWSAATSLRGNPRDMRSKFHELEDAAKARALELACQPC